MFRYLRVLEENSALKKYANQQEEKMKKLATKLIRYEYNYLSSFLSKQFDFIFAYPSGSC